jgi:hypothetical protein
MARSSKLGVMISSRRNDSFPADPAGRPLSEIRMELKKEIEAFEIFDEKIFEIWINVAKLALAELRTDEINGSNR